ncbi:MAG: YHS domain-containing protein [Candidatus Krumholzibacteriia bacterium]
MHTLRFITTAVALATIAAGAGAAPADKAAPQTTCPVTGKPIDRSVSTTYEGQKIYFCCPQCVAPFLKDPETYLTKLGAQGRIVESHQTLCPVLGDPIDPKVFVDYHGRRVFFCCRACIADFQKDPAQYLPRLGRIAS